MKASMDSAEIRYVRTFAHGASELYIYGAGARAWRYAKILEACSIRLDGFLVSSERHEAAYYGYPVFSAAEIRLTEHTRIIAGFRGARLRDLKIAGIQREQCLFLTPEVFDRLTVKALLIPLLESIARKFPVQPLPDRRIPAKNLLILRLDVIGDLLFTIPFLRELRRNYPDAHITLVVWEKMHGLMRDCPYVDEVLAYSCPLQEGDPLTQFSNWESKCKRIRVFVEAKLSARKYDIVFLPRILMGGRNCVDEFVMAMMSDATYRVGRFDEFSVWYHAVWEPYLARWMSHIYLTMEPKHEVAYMLDLLHVCGCEVVDDRMEYWLPLEAVSFAQDLISGKRGYLYIACGIVSRDANRSWAPEKYRELVKRFEGQPMRFLLLGGKDAKDAAEIIGEHSNVMDLTGQTTFQQAAAVVSLSNLYLGSNTGLLHFASASGTPVVEISAWLSDGNPMDNIAPERMGAWGVPTISLIPKTGLDGCHDSCRRSFAHCINTITVDEVQRAIQKLLTSVKVN